MSLRRDASLRIYLTLSSDPAEIQRFHRWPANKVRERGRACAREKEREGERERGGGGEIPGETASFPSTHFAAPKLETALAPREKERQRTGLYLTRSEMLNAAFQRAN